MTKHDVVSLIARTRAEMEMKLLKINAPFQNSRLGHADALQEFEVRADRGHVHVVRRGSSRDVTRDGVTPSHDDFVQYDIREGGAPGSSERSEKFAVCDEEFVWSRFQ